MSSERKRTVPRFTSTSEDRRELLHFANRAKKIATPKEREAVSLRRAKPRRGDPRTWE